MELERPTEKIRAETNQRLRNEAAHMEVDVDLYVASTDRERRIIKMNAHRALKKRARKFGLDPEEFIEWTPEKRSAAEEQNRAEGKMPVEEPRKRKPRKRKPPEEEAEEPQPTVDPDDDPDEEDEASVYSEGMEVPANDMDPHRRSGITIGPIVEEDRPPDLVGDQPPLTLADLYARWPIGRPGGDDYYIRVERIHPKKFQEVNCAGFLAEVRRPMTEEQFQKWFGGREYHLTLYGPNPRHRRDANGDVIIKRLTAPIHVVVPHAPPNLHVMPAFNRPPQQEQNMHPQDPSNPFATVFPRAPMTSADANIHASSLRFYETMFKHQQDELREARRGQQNNGSDPTKLLGFATDMTKTQVEAISKDAERREQILRDQLEVERSERKEIDQELREMKRQMQEHGLARQGESIEFLKYGDAANQRQSEYYRQQLESAQRSHEEQMRLLREAHSEELKRERDRFRDLEDHYKRVAEEDRRAAAEREKVLKEEVDRVRREERDNAERRVNEVEKAAQRRYEDAEKAHEREMRTIKDNLDVKFTSERNKLEFELASVKDRMEEAKAEAQRVREESDPIKIVESRKAELKAFGFVEKDPEAPTSVWERFAQAAGGGVGQFLANTDPGALMGAFSAITSGGRPQGRPQVPGRAPHQLPPGHPQAAAQAAAQAAPQRRRRAETWASQGSPVAKTPGPPGPNEAPMGMQQPGEQPPPAASQPQPEQPAPAAPPAPEQPEAAPQPPPQIKLPPSKFHEIFDDQAILSFLQNVEGAINMGFPPKEFAKRFHQQFPEQSVQLAQRYKPQDAVEYVRSIPQATGSPILRRDGGKWLDKMWPAILEVAGVSANTEAGQPAETESPS